MAGLNDCNNLWSYRVCNVECLKRINTISTNEQQTESNWPMRDGKLATPLEYGPDAKWFFDVVVVPKRITVPTTKLQRSTAVSCNFILSYETMSKKIVTSKTQEAHQSIASVAVVNINKT